MEPTRPAWSRPAARRAGRRSLRPALALVLCAATAAGCSKLAALDAGSNVDAAAAASTTAPAGGLAQVPFALSDAGRDRTCDNTTTPCAVVLDAGAPPRHALSYDLAPGASWTGTIERQQQCVDAAGTPHGEAVRATVTGTVTAADAAGNLLAEVVVQDVLGSDPAVGAVAAEQFPLGQRTSVLFSDRGLLLRPMRPPIAAAALITPLPPQELAVGGTWEVRRPAQGERDVTQLRLDAADGSRASVVGITGDWLDVEHRSQRVTATSAAAVDTAALGPDHRTIVERAGVFCASGTADGPVTYVVARTAP